MEARLVRLDAEQLDRLREKVVARNGVVIYRKPDWLHAAYRKGKPGGTSGTRPAA